MGSCKGNGDVATVGGGSGGVKAGDEAMLADDFCSLPNEFFYFKRHRIDALTEAAAQVSSTAVLATGSASNVAEINETQKICVSRYLVQTLSRKS